jgi:hypothetical protein
MPNVSSICVSLASSRSPYSLYWLYQFLVHRPYDNYAICVPYKVSYENKEAGVIC